MKFLLTLLLVVPLFSFAQSSVITFDVEMNGDLIGTLKATRNATGKRETRNLSSSTKANVLALSVNVESEIYMISENDVLLTSFAYRQVNHGSDNIETTVKTLSPGRYSITRNGKSKIHEGVITFCVVDLYFREPKGIGSVFSNTHGEYLRLKNQGPGQYQLILPDGKTNTFSYINGKLTKVEARLMMGKIIFRRK